MSESIADQFGPNAGIPPPPDDPSMGVNVAAMQEALSQVPPLRTPLTPASSARFASVEERNAARVLTEKNNPAESIEDVRARLMAERGERLSLNAPELNLSVPEIAGYHLHWFLETNIPLALRGWYEFVVPGEVDIPDKNIGGRPKSATSEDLGGNRITQLNKGPGANGLPIQFVLMKIRQEFYFEEQRKIADRNYSIIAQIFKLGQPLREPGERPSDFNMRYTKEAIFDMSMGRFRRKGAEA